MLADWAGMLVAHYYTQPTTAIKKEVYLEFQLDGSFPVLSSAFWPFTTAGHEKLWFYAQARHACMMKEELEGRLSASCPIVLTSNVEAPIDVVATRLDAEKVQYIQDGGNLRERILALEKRGKLCLSKKGRKLLFAWEFA